MDPYVGEIRVMAFNFAPRGWAQCNGQLLPLSQNTALFSLLGTMYGGDGRSTFGLPDLEGRATMMWGQGPGLSDRTQGEPGGQADVILTQAEMPVHDHSLDGASQAAEAGNPAGLGLGGARGATPYAQSSPDAQMDAGALSPTGSGMPHTNMQPSLAMNVCIALLGVFPPRT